MPSNYPPAAKLNSKEKDLTRRYLVWCYKTTKEELDKIDRYFTQNYIDEFLLEKLKKIKTKGSGQKGYEERVKKFAAYKDVKLNKAKQAKFIKGKKGSLQPQYFYLQQRLEALEKATTYFLGKRELGEIIKSYESEMTQRILQAREHT